MTMRISELLPHGRKIPEGWLWSAFP